MSLKTVFGATILVLGVVLMTAPFISGLTGFFIITGNPILPAGPNFDLGYSLAGFLLSLFGYFLVKPKKQNILS